MAFRKKRIVLVIGCISSFLIAEQFLIKNKKTPSVSKLKEQCCEQYARIMQDVPDLLHVIADLQTKAITVIADYCDGDKTSSFQQASKDELLVYNQALSQIESILSNMKNQLAKQVEKL